MKAIAQLLTPTFFYECRICGPTGNNNFANCKAEDVEKRLTDLGWRVVDLTKVAEGPFFHKQHFSAEGSLLCCGCVTAYNDGCVLVIDPVTRKYRWLKRSRKLVVSNNGDSFRT